MKSTHIYIKCIINNNNNNNNNNNSNNNNNNYNNNKHIKEKKILFTIHNFKYKYVQGKIIYVKVTSCSLVLKSAKKLVRKNSGSAFHCLGEK